MSGIRTVPRFRALVLAGAMCLTMLFAGSGARAAERQGCQAVGPDSASCTFVVTRFSTIQVVAVAAQYWEVDVDTGTFSSLCAFGRVGASIGQCFASPGSTVRAVVRGGAIIVQGLQELPTLP